MNKIDKLDKELEKAREKAAEWQAKIRELEKQKHCPVFHFSQLQNLDKFSLSACELTLHQAPQLSVDFP